MPRLTLLFVVVALLVTGCAGGVPAAPTLPVAPSATSLPSATALPSVTTLPSATAQASATEQSTSTAEATATVSVAELVKGDMMPGCTMVSLFPTPGPTQASLFPPVSKEDWVQGAETASVTIIEYSDFQ